MTSKDLRLVEDGDREGFVQIRGARENNLKNVDLDVPRNALVVFTGISGSGKSSLAFGTIYAEAQRRYFASVAPYARRLIQQVGVPEVDAIEGLPPAVALQQTRGGANARSTVGSVTTISSLVRMLYSRAGVYPADQSMLYAEDFSPNTVEGACPTCHGIGRIYDVTEQTLVPDDSLTIRDRAIAAWPPAWHGQNLRDILVSMGYDVDTPWRDLPKKDRDWILFTDEQPTVPVYAGLTPAQTKLAKQRRMQPSYQGTFTGAKRYILETFANSKSERMKKRVSQYMISAECPTCHGKKLKPEALSVTFEGLDIHDFSELTLARLMRLLETVTQDDWMPANDADAGVPDARDRAAAIADRVAAGGSAHSAAPDIRRTPNQSEEKRITAQRLSADLIQRLRPVLDLGLGYLALNRTTPTLSSGELQRLRLATQISAQLFGVVYVLDEPSAGLHPADGEALDAILQRLKRSGNSVFLVEHSLDLIRKADWLVDIGVGAGSHGGNVLYNGPPAGLADVPDSITRRYLFGDAAPLNRTPRVPQGWLKLADVSRNNLAGLDAEFPLACMTCVTGVSGSGKSSLVAQALPELVAARLGRKIAGTEVEEDGDLLLDGETNPLTGEIVGSIGKIKRVVLVDQKPIGRTPRSNLATYTGVFDHVRNLFAATPAAKKRRYTASRFSFNLAPGRCPTCEGEGMVMVELLFLPSIYAPCSTCHGKRYNEKTLEVEWQGKTIADTLDLTVEEACAFFASEPEIERPLIVLRDLGLGYLKLGQPATELSGGEAQRVKLATELQKARRGDGLYVLDEASAGLHPADTDRLMRFLQALVDNGNTVVMVEHDMRVVAQSDWVIDMGPGAGDEGGQIIAAGTPVEVAEARASKSAPYLRRTLQEFVGEV